MFSSEGELDTMGYGGVGHSQGSSNPSEWTDREADIFSGMLVRDGKLHRFVLNNKGVLIQSSLAVRKRDKQWELAGKRVITTSEAKPHTFMVSFGKSKLKLGANSEEEMLGWMEALTKAEYMAG